MFDMKLCIGIARGWAEQDVRLKNWVEVLQSQALTERVFEFELPDYKLLNANEVRFCQQLSENIEKSSKELKTTPKIFVLPYQNILMDEAECLDKIAYFIKKVCKEKGRKEPTVLVVGSAFYQYKNVDFVDYAQYLLTEDEENKWKQDKELKEKSVLSVGIPFRLNMEMCQRAAEQPEQAAELAKFQAYPKKVLFVLGGLQDNYQIKFDVADALRLADRALDFAMSGYKVIFMNQPTTPNDVTDFIYDFGRRNDMLFYNRKSLMNGDASLRYDSKFLHEFMAQQQRCGDMYPAILSVLENGVYVGTMGDFSYISDALALKLRTVVYAGNNLSGRRYYCKRLADICVQKQYVFDFYDDKVFDSAVKLKPFPSGNESILKLLINKKFKKFKNFLK